MTFTRRATWSDTPDPVRTAVAGALGAPIVGHTDLHGGMSPGPAAGLRLADGRRVFVKAISAEVRALNHAMIRRESTVLDALPASVPAPRPIVTVTHGPWIALVTTWADGTAGGRWTDRAIAAVARACRTASAHRAPAVLPPVADRLADFDGWSRVLAAGPDDPWEAAHAGPAADMVAGWARWTTGPALVHRDIRRDNTAVAASAVLLDWGYAAAGAPWIDLAQLAADVVATGHAGGPRVATDRAYRLLRTLPPEAARFAVGLAGVWRIRATTIPDTVVPGLATWRRRRSVALRPLVTRLIADHRDPPAAWTGARC